MTFIARISYAIFWLIVMVLAGWGTYKAVLDQPDVMPEDKNHKIEKDIGVITARTPRVEELGPDGRVRWRLESEDMEGDIEGSFRMTNSRTVIMLEDGTEIILTAPQGEYDRKKRYLTMKGGVDAVNEIDGSSFWAEEMSWDGESRVMKSGGGEIKLTRKNWDFHASGITINLSGDETIIELDEPVNLVGYR